ncbi:purine-binding chemotaxis protein chew [Heliomicrobium modesticaldum Ice1]|uniref:Chemotaxis protein CheW n=1 Tax=Heliobacterium modesticaldum (strain ATCC 51547 / Ice1) TaxID=498761 RepID=B0THC9_HELMI|nr:chemotaxis protein CheW [Heliomicrobium modesticaldum]ABZ84804.1 purine-binding chemotaxis protein chew [Heliomicrobium modesticaldum Ice1]
MEKKDLPDERQLVAFTLAGEEYAVDIHYVQEIDRLLNITRVPKAPFYVEGVINLRGNVVPVIDLRKRFALPPRETTDRTRIIIVKVKEITVGIIVDGVSEVTRIPSTAVEPPPGLCGSVDLDFIHGVGKLGERLLILVNLEKVIDLAAAEEG